MTIEIFHPLDRLRSLLFLPALKPRYLQKALSIPAAAFILDLEDSIGPSLKSAAREALGPALGILRASGRPVFVRVNAGEPADLDSVATLSLAGLILPKVESAEDIGQVDAVLRQAGNPLPLLASIETPTGLHQAGAIAGHPATAALMFGAGDFLATSGIADRDELLMVPALAVNFAARMHGKRAFGLAGTIAEYRDLGRLEALVRRASELGFVGAPAIHPDQIAVLNAGFTPSAENLSRAHRIVAAYEESDGSAFQIDGTLVERATYEQAKAMLDALD